jgi:hypothetical protein
MASTIKAAESSIYMFYLYVYVLIYIIERNGSSDAHSPPLFSVVFLTMCIVLQKASGQKWWLTSASNREMVAMRSESELSGSWIQCSTAAVTCLAFPPVPAYYFFTIKLER